MGFEIVKSDYLQQALANELSIKFHLSRKYFGSGGIQTHASEETGALNQRLRPLGHATTSVLNVCYIGQGLGSLGAIFYTVLYTLNVVLSHNSWHSLQRPTPDVAD